MATINTPAAGVSPYQEAAADPVVLRASANGSTVLSAATTPTTAVDANISVVVTGQAALNGLILSSRTGVFDGANVTINLEEQNFNTTNQVTATTNYASGANGSIQYNNGSNGFDSDPYFTYTDSNVITPGIRTNNYLYANGAPFLAGGNAAIGNFVFTGDTMTISDANQIMSITGNGTGNIRVTSNGNIWTFNNVGNLTLPSNTSSINYANGSPYGGGDYSNSNVSSFLAAFGSNVVSTTGNITGNYFIGNGSQLTGISTSLPLANGTSNINIATANGNVTITANGSPTWTFKSDGNLTLPTAGNIVGAVNIIGNGTGNVNVIANNKAWTFAADGNLVLPLAGNIVNDGNTWNFGYNGNLTLPANIIAINYANGNRVTGNISFRDEIVIGTGTSNLISGLYLAPSSSSADANMYLRVRGNINDEPTHIHFDTGNNAYYNQFIGDDNKYIQLANTGNIVINSNNGAGNSAQWNFVSDGNLTLPNGAVIKDNTGNSVAFGKTAGNTGQGISSVAIGYGAGLTNQGNQSVAIGENAGANQGSTAVAIGQNAGGGVALQGDDAVAIGHSAGANTQGTQSVAIGLYAGETTQGIQSVAIGSGAGYDTQGANSVAIGSSAGNATQGIDAVAVGVNAGGNVQGNAAVAVGPGAGYDTQGIYSVAVGPGAGQTSQGSYSVAIGVNAGNDTQGANSIAIGGVAGQSAQGNNSIILNATGVAVNQTTANTFTVAPVRNDVANIAEIVFYNATSKEITYGNTISVAGNVSTPIVYSNGMAVEGYDFVQMQYSNAVALPVSPYDIGTGSWFFLDPAGATWESNTTGTLKTVVLGNDGSVSAVGNITGNNLAATNLVINSITSDDSTFVTIEDGLSVETGLISAPENLSLSAGGNSWTFGTDGNLTVPGAIITTSNSKLDLYGAGTNTAYLTTTTNDSTALYMTAEEAQLYANANVVITANTIVDSQIWNFDDTGNLTFPTGNLVIIPDAVAFSNAAVIASANHNLITLSTGANGGTSSLWVEDYANIGTSNIAAVYANPTLGSGNVRIATGANGGGGPKLWDFQPNGNLTAPGNIITTGNITGAYLFGNGSQLTDVGAASVPGQNILPTIQTITVAATSGVGNAGGGGSAFANVTVSNVTPVTEYGVIITSGTSSQKYATGALGSIPGTVQLTFTTGLNSTLFTVYAYVTSNAGTFYSNSATGTSGICLLAGTQIALSDGTHKAIEDITYTDKLLSWDFDRGCYAETTAMWIKRSETGSQYNLLTFSDGTTLRTFDQHRIFNKQAGAFTYPMTAATPIGTITVNEHGQEITLTRKQVIRDIIEYYNVITSHHMNLFSDSVLTSCRFNNIYPIVDMKFEKDSRTLRTRAEFENVPDRFFHGLRLAEQTADIETVEWYVNRLLRTEVSSHAELTV
jgi:hypothetical protein